MRGLPRHLSYANVMVTLLAFVVLCGGTAFAVNQLGKESVGARQLKKNAVTGAKVKDGSLRPKDFKGAFGTGPGTPGSAGPSGAGPVYQEDGDVNYDELSTTIFGSTAVTLPVPPAPYFVTASVTVQDVNATPDDITCRLINGTGGSGSTAVIRTQMVRIDGLDSFTLSGGFQVSAGQALNLQCYKDVPASGARITEANIVAVQVQSVSGLPG